MMRFLSFCFLLLSISSAVAGPEFEKVPPQAMSALQGARGKSVASGAVFVNGKFVKGPYRVARMGTALFVNNVQVTGEIIPWRSFLSAANGGGAVSTAAVSTTESPAEESSAPAKPATAVASSIDDLFDDDPAPVAKPAARERPRKAASSAALPTGTYEENAQTRKFLKRIDSARTEVQRRLRVGDLCFFSSRYPQVNVDANLARTVLGVLPEALRDAADAEGLQARLRARGWGFLHRELCEDLIANRMDYLQLQGLRKKLEDEARLNNLLNGGRR